jgi:hypothetical protein
LVVGHLGEVVKDEVVLRPVGKDRPVSSVGDEFLGKLSHFWVEIVHDVVNYAGSLGSFGRVPIVRIGFDAVSRTEAIHVYVSVLFELSRELGSEDGVQMEWEVSQSIHQRLLLLFLAETGSADGSMGKGVRSRSWLR